MRILLDPGHNPTGKDIGAGGYGLREENLTVQIANQVADLLTARGFEVNQTRKTITDNIPFANAELNPSLTARVALAESFKADLFVSIHINATPAGTGSEVIVCARGGEAEKLANKVAPLLANAGGWNNRGVKTDIEASGKELYVLRKTSMPAILTECGFIDNLNDNAKLADSVYRTRIAVAHAQGICAYAGVAYDIPATATPPPTPVPTPTTPTTPVSTTPPTGANITPLNGGKGWIEVAADGRVITHATNYAYLTVAPDGSVWSYGPGRDAVKLV
jgi:N-acetylmuramoyl-L-alanine amidase